MEVQIKFDTENDSIDDLKKLVAGLQDIIIRRGGSPVNIPERSENKAEENAPEQKPRDEERAGSNVAPRRTVGGCRVVEYEDISQTMNSFYTGKNY